MPACCCDQHGGRQRAHACARARAVRHVHEVDAVDAQLTRLLDECIDTEPARRNQLAPRR